MLKFIHASDFHLDSAFGALAEKQAAARRRESRELGFRLANYVNSHGIDLVLLAGDLFDSDSAFRDTREQLAAALGQMEARVFIAPGNHDRYDRGWESVSRGLSDGVALIVSACANQVESIGEEEVVFSKSKA